VPPENQPELSALIDLGGRQFRTPARRSLYAVPNARVVIAANHFDDRLVTVRVVQRDDVVQRDVGVVQVRLADLLARGHVALRETSLARVELVVAPADGQEWSFSGCSADGVHAGPLSASRPAAR
jgi:hypothetical protein